MKKKVSLALAFALTLSMGLTACAPGGAAAQSAEAPQSSAGASTNQAAPAEITTVEQVKNLYHEELTVDEVWKHEGGWLVEYHQNSAEDVRELEWVFPSGWRTYIGAFTETMQYEVTGPAEVTIYTQGDNIANSYRTMPQKEVSCAREGDDLAVWKKDELFLPLEESWTFGLVSRPEQLYQARVGLKGVECAFIPSGNNVEDFGGFFVASTSIPLVETGFEPESRQFTLRMKETALSSGGITPEEIAEQERGGAPKIYRDLYPYSFPEGDLETDSRWITAAQLTQDGEDALITLTLAPEVVGYRLEADNLGDDDMPCFDLEFTRVERNLFPTEYLLN